MAACGPQEGDLRYVKLEVERSTELVQVTLVWHASSQEEAQLGISWGDGECLGPLIPSQHLGPPLFAQQPEGWWGSYGRKLSERDPYHPKKTELYEPQL